VKLLQKCNFIFSFCHWYWI